MRVVVGIGAAVAVVLVGFLIWVYSGSYEVAATTPGGKGWLYETLTRQSVRARAKGIEVPALADPAMTADGARRFAEACAACHGAPGQDQQAFAAHMRPPAQALTESPRRWSSAELFWIARSGLRSSGMPAFGEIYGDDQLWPVVAFIQQLPEMSPEHYAELVAPPAPPAEEAPPSTSDGEPQAVPEGQTQMPPGEMPAPQQGEQPQAPVPPRE
ncbi:MAG: cytochrome c [Magnetospirillum sp.]|nr:cytochrome c [Magnetospirillum sp.]